MLRLPGGLLLLYTWFKTLNNGDMWTYMTADGAMCCLLGDDCPYLTSSFARVSAGLEVL
jgi:hypothetical protein